MFTSRPTASEFTRKFSCAAAICLGLLSISTASAIAAPTPPPAPTAPVIPATPVAPVKAAPTPAAPASVSAELAVCPGQTFSQPFEALKDSNYYTLVEGSEFNEGSGGWELTNRAAVVEGTHPDGSSGRVLDLPSGSVAISPPVCVTLQYPTARAFVQTVEGGGGVTVGVVYPGVKSGPIGQPVGQLNAKPNTGWELSSSFNVNPQLAGKEEGVREARFIFANTTKSSDFHVFGLYVDPRMR